MPERVTAYTLSVPLRLALISGVVAALTLIVISTASDATGGDDRTSSLSQRVPATSTPIPPTPSPTPDSVVRTVPSGSEAQPWPEGIFETRQAPLSRLYVIENHWNRERGSSHLKVYAGALATDPSQGLVVVTVTSADLKQQQQEVFLTSERAGALRVVAARGAVLSLVSERGQNFTFDIDALSFTAAESLPVWQSGIAEPEQLLFPAGQPFPAGVFDVENVWQGLVDERWVRVFAGNYLSNPDQGVLVVQSVPVSLWPDDPAAVGSGPDSVRETPEPIGRLRIQGASDGNLTVVAGDGRTLMFDVRTGAFE